MDTLSYKTVSANRDTVKKEWVLVDATDQVLGRLTSVVAKILRGKLKPDFTPHVYCGDNVIIVNAEKIRLTGKKMDDKEYIWNTGYPGGQRKINVRGQMAKNPAVVVEKAVKGMLPRNRLGREQFRNLHVLVGSDHPYKAQKPKKINLNSIR